MKKCTKCGSPIPNGEFAYFEGKLVCQTCYSRLRKNKIRKTSMQDIYDKWIENENSK